MNLSDFLAARDQFKLGQLSTESFHWRTQNLSEMCRKEPGLALDVIKQVDIEAFNNIADNVIQQLVHLQKDIKTCLSRGGRVFLAGCGATGRLSLNLEWIWKEMHPAKADKVIAFMAGGDLALVKSFEGYEDFPERGAEHLRQLGFDERDLLIAITEGGETPFVIGAAEQATKTSQYSTYFIYCNPTHQLMMGVDRSARIISNKKVYPICLRSGPMALAGSTRMQASSLQMAAVGLCLVGSQMPKTGLTLQDNWNVLKQQLKLLNYTKLLPLLLQEAEAYERGDRVLYRSQSLALPLFTDITERSPTFSMIPFCKRNEWSQAGLSPFCFFACTEIDSSEKAWKKLLHRSPRPFRGTEQMIQSSEFLDYDFSEVTAQKWKDCWQVQQTVIWEWDPLVGLKINSDRVNVNFKECRGHLLFVHLAVKVLLNALSTVVMGRLGRFEQNVMTWVRPSNYKLIDRTLRYAQQLLQQQGLLEKAVSYEQLARVLFSLIDQGIPTNQSLVMHLVAEVQSQHGDTSKEAA